MKKRSMILAAAMMLSVSLVTACGGAGAAKSGATTGDGSLDRVKKAGKLEVAIDATYPPDEFVDKDGKTPIGFDIDYAKALAQKMGLQADFQIVDWDGIIAGLKGKRYDVIISSMNITPERQKEVNFVQYTQMGQIFVSRPGITINGPQDFAGKTVAVQEDTTSDSYVEDLKSNKGVAIKDIVTYKTFADAFLALKNKRSEALVVDEPVGLYYAKLDPASFQVDGKALDTEPVGIAIRKEDTTLTEAIQKAVTDLQNDGTYTKISTQWFGHELGK